MTPSRPYFVRAVYEWLNDNELTPFVVVDAAVAGTQVPMQHVQEGRITLNIGQGAVRDLFMNNDGISFSARFGGVPMNIYAPMIAVKAIYARENGQGMFFENDDEFDPPPGESADAAKPAAVPGGSGAPTPPKRPSLKVVK